MTHSTNKDYWTPKALYSAKQLAMATCMKDTSLLPSLSQVSAAITSDLAGMLAELPAAELESLADQLEMPGADSQELAASLMERSIVSQILAETNWKAQKANQPPTPEILSQLNNLTIWDYLESSLVMR